MKKALLTTAAVLAIVALTGCDQLDIGQQMWGDPSSAPVAPPTPGHHVVMVGDSVTWASQDALRAHISDMVISAEGGRNPNYSPSGGPTTMQEITRLIPQIAPGGWLVVQEDACEPIQPIDIMTVAYWLPDDRGLAWVSPDHEGCSGVAQSRDEVQRGILAQPVHTYVNWAAWREANTDGLTVDRVHPNENGAGTLATLVYQATWYDARVYLP